MMPLMKIEGFRVLRFLLGSDENSRDTHTKKNRKCR